MSAPFFTLITPVYNIERLLHITVQSAMEQTFTDWEMVLIDDGSPDNAGVLCDEYAKQDARIKVVHKQNEGLAAARNTGIENAKGKYFIILEGSDRFFDENSLQRLYDYLKDNEVDIYFTKLRDVLEKGLVATNVQADYCVNGEFIGGKELFIKLFDNDDILALSAPVNKVYRTAFVKDNNLYFYKGIYHDDDEWIPRAIALSNRCCFTNEIMYDALTWDGCLGGAVSDKSLTRKACDKMLIAEHCCKTIDKIFEEQGTEFKKKYYEYYVHMYLDGIVSLNKVQDEECRAKIKASIKERKDVFTYAGKCGAKNLRLLSKVRKIFGLGIAQKLILRRYR